MISLPLLPGTKFKSLDCMGYPTYRVGDDGSVWSIHPKRSVRDRLAWRQKCPTNDGMRMLVNLTKDGKGKTFTVSRLVLWAFIGPCPEGMECCHWDGDPTNNRLENLRWDTPESNYADKVRHGTDNRGSRNWSAKLTENQVRSIRKEYAAGGVSLSQLARKYGIAIGTVHPIVQRRTWKYISD